jgi:hypothetical protein
MIGIGAGNNPKEIANFKSTKNIPFPLFPDPHFEAYEAIGDPGGTPHMLVTKKAEGGHLVAWVHTGLIRSPGPFLREAAWALDSDLAALKARASEEPAVAKREVDYKSQLTPEELEEKVRASFVELGTEVVSVSPIRLAGDEEVYVGKLDGKTGKSRLFAKIASRLPVCDLCHSTHFIFVFDEQGTIVNFLPLQVTKYGNEPWNEQEILKMKKRLVGQSVTSLREFDPAVDAITSATMTSALIFDAIREAETTYAALKKEGTLKD